MYLCQVDSYYWQHNCTFMADFMKLVKYTHTHLTLYDFESYETQHTHKHNLQAPLFLSLQNTKTSLPNHQLPPPSSKSAAATNIATTNNWIRHQRYWILLKPVVFEFRWFRWFLLCGLGGVSVVLSDCFM